MGSRVPNTVTQQQQQQQQQQQYTLRSVVTDNPYVGSSLHDLNSIDADGVIDDGGISDVDRNGLDDEDEDCLHEYNRHSLPSIHGVGVEEHNSPLDESSSSPYDILTVDDILPIENARARFLQIVVDYFINDHMIEVADHSEVDYSSSQSAQDNKLHKRSAREVHYEGDPRYALPLMYVANLYETLVTDVNVRLEPFSGLRDKTIGVALEAAGGLYRRLAKKFPKNGPYSFRRRELATSLETRTRFPELVVHDQKRVRFVVVNGLGIVEKPNNVPVEDADWFKRLTGRHEMAVSGRDYKFYSPRHKFRRVGSNSVSSIPDLSPQHQQQSTSKHHIQPIQHQPQFHSLRQSHPQPMHQSQHTAHYAHTQQFVPSPHLPEIHQSLQPSTMPQHVTCMQPLTGGQVGGRLHILPTNLAKFCDGCGAPYLRETSKFCSECGLKRLGT